MLQKRDILITRFVCFDSCPTEMESVEYLRLKKEKRNKKRSNENVVTAEGKRLFI